MESYSLLKLPQEHYSINFWGPQGAEGTQSNECWEGTWVQMKEARDGFSSEPCKTSLLYSSPSTQRTRFPLRSSQCWTGKLGTLTGELLFLVKFKDWIFLNSCFWYFRTNLICLPTDWNWWLNFSHQRVPDFPRIWALASLSRTSFCFPCWLESLAWVPAQAHLLLFPRLLWLEEQYMKFRK